MIGIAGNMMAGFGKRAAGPELVASARNLEIAGSNGARSVTITLPAEAAPGDKLLMMATCVNSGSLSSNTNIALPAGWTNIQNESGGVTDGPSSRFMQRTVQPGDTSWNVTASVGILLVVELQVWRNANATLGNRQLTRPLDSTSVAAQIGSTTLGSAMAVFGFFHRSANGAPTINSSPAESILAGSQANAGVRTVRTWSGWERRLQGGATGTRTWSVTNNTFSVMMLQEILKP